jgi:thioredoxin reductase
METTHHQLNQADVAIIGGGPAGLQAALTLGRIHRDVVLFDDGTYRNAKVAHMHNVVASDGTAPAQFRTRARTQLAAYDIVTVRDARVSDVVEADGGFRLTIADGTVLTAEALILATGVRDELPEVDGLEDLWGDLAAHCPFCHAHEFSGQRIAILGAEAAPHLATLLGPMASDLLVLTQGEDLPESWSDGAAALRVEKVLRLERHERGVRVRFAEGADEHAAVIFVASTLRQSAPFAERLGLELNRSGGVRIDEFGRSSLLGVFCAGDMAHLPAHPKPMTSVTMAAAAGQLAANAAQMHLTAAGH